MRLEFNLGLLGGDDAKHNGSRRARMTPAERKGVLAASVITAVGIGWFAVMLVNRLWSSRRFSDPLRDGDIGAAEQAMAGAELAVDGAELASVTSVLFVSPRGIGRSRMAAAYLRALTLGTHRIETAGAVSDPASTPASAQNEAFMVMALDQAGFDAGRPPQQVSPDLVQRADLVVRIGCPRAFRVPVHIPVRDWDLPDPVGAGVSAAWEVRDDIKRRVEELAADLGLVNRSLALRDRVIPGQRQVFATGRAAEPYPHDGDGESN
jgi:protein-tyrosine-phosphatase